jgi:hypothetical protein
MLPLFLSINLLAACGGEEGPGVAADAVEEKAAVAAPDAGLKPGPGTGMTTAKPKSPVAISYRIIGQPVVGQPVAIDLQFESGLGPQAFNVDYRINDTSALQFPETQDRKVTVSPPAGKAVAAQQVRVIPMREGRLYLNVAAEVETDAGVISSVTAVPIDVGAPVDAIGENGVLTTDESGESIRVLPARED